MAKTSPLEPPFGWVSFTKTWHDKPYPAISPTRPELSAAGKNVLVTGGGTGIGKAIAIAFAQAGAASVAILGRRIDRLESAAAELREAGPATLILYETADLCQRSEVDTAFESIVKKSGKIDIFVSNAGMLPALGPGANYSVDEFRRTFELNTVSALNAVQAFLPLANPGAKLFNTSSSIGHFEPMSGMFAYAMSKAAGIKMLDYIAAENPELHIVHIQPGVIDTEASKGAPHQDDVSLPGAFLVWLASPEARFLKSKFVWANWDVHELMSRAKEIEGSMLLRVLLEGVPM